MYANLLESPKKKNARAARKPCSLQLSHPTDLEKACKQNIIEISPAIGLV